MKGKSSVCKHTSAAAEEKVSICFQYKKFCTTRRKTAIWLVVAPWESFFSSAFLAFLSSQHTTAIQPPLQSQVQYNWLMFFYWFQIWYQRKAEKHQKCFGCSKILACWSEWFSGKLDCFRRKKKQVGKPRSLWWLFKMTEPCHSPETSLLTRRRWRAYQSKAKVRLSIRQSGKLRSSLSFNIIVVTVCSSWIIQGEYNFIEINIKQQQQQERIIRRYLKKSINFNYKFSD